MMINLKHNFPLLSLILVVSVIFAWVFGERIISPDSFMFYNEYDGLKNYYTLCSYVLGDEAIDNFFILGMNYPFGESIIYTDNTPLFAFIIKYCTNASKPQEVIAWFNIMIILSLYLGHLACFRLSQRLNIADWPSVMVALVVPVMIPMVFKLAGHCNLSLPITLILPILLTINVFYYHRLRLNTRSWSYLVLLVLTMGSLFLVHIYLFVFSFLIASIYLAYQLMLFICIERDYSFIFKFVALTASSLLAMTGILYATDPWISERPGGHNGYAIPDYVVKCSDLFTSIEAFTLPALGGTVPWANEDYAFMGSAFPFAILIIAVSFIIGYSQMKKALIDDRVSQALVLICFICFFISLGDNIKTHDGTSGITNVFNVFSILTEISDRFMNIRCINRFFWITSLLFHLLFLKFLFSSTLDLLWGKWRYILITLAVSTYCLDAFDAFKYQRNDFHYANPFTVEELSPFVICEKETYQAILPLPYFSVGSESDLKYTIDAHGEWSTKCMQIALANDLNLMAGLLSRTPPRITKNLHSIFDLVPNNQLLDNLDERSILILKDLIFFYPEIRDPKMVELSLNTSTFIEDNIPYISSLDTVDEVVFYKLDSNSFN